MSTDRELLELAAKAAGMNYLVWTPGASPLVPSEHRMADRVCWNPLTDDGDALRLAVVLGILELAAAEVCLSCNQVGDAFESTRRAIVRAAAEIGRAKP